MTHHYPPVAESIPLKLCPTIGNTLQPHSFLHSFIHTRSDRHGTSKWDRDNHLFFEIHFFQICVPLFSEVFQRTAKLKGLVCFMVVVGSQISGVCFILSERVTTAEIIWFGTSRRSRIKVLKKKGEGDFRAVDWQSSHRTLDQWTLEEVGFADRNKWVQCLGWWKDLHYK